MIQLTYYIYINEIGELIGTELTNYNGDTEPHGFMNCGSYDGINYVVIQL